MLNSILSRETEMVGGATCWVQSNFVLARSQVEKVPSSASRQDQAQVQGFRSVGRRVAAWTSAMAMMTCRLGLHLQQARECSTRRCLSATMSAIAANFLVVATTRG